MTSLAFTSIKYVAFLLHKMITFRISFLLAFYLSPPVPKKEKSESGEEREKSAKGSRKLDKSSKSSKSERTENSKKKEQALHPKPDYVLETGNPIGYAHIEYELIPNRPKQVIDVICWNKVAKVFVDEETLTFKCRIVDEMIWVPIFVQHCINSLETRALIDFYNHAINFVIFTKKQKLGARGKSEKTKQFYIRQEDVNIDDTIVFAYSEDPNLKDTKISEKEATLEDAMREILTDCIYKPGIKNKEEMLTRFNFNDDIHTFRVNEIIRKNSNGEYMCFKEYIPTSLPPDDEDDNIDKNEEKTVTKAKGKKVKTDKENKKAQKKKEKKSKTEKGDTGGPLHIKVSSEVFFTNPKFSAFDLKQLNNVISKAFVLLSVDHLMTIRQKYDLNPLVIRINKIDNLPADVLKAHKSVFVRYNIPHIAQGKTMEKNVDNQVRINEAHAHFTNEIPNIRFSEFMTSKRLCVEICGVLDDYSEIPEASLFGSEGSDKLLWKRLTPYDCFKRITDKSGESRVVVLAVACYDLSSLIVPTWDFLFNESCHNPDNILFRKPADSYACRKLEHVTPANINLKIPCKRRNGSPLTELILTERNTCLKVEAFLNAPTVHIKCDMMASTCFYVRMFVTLVDKNTATSFLNQLLLRNQCLNKDIVTKSLLQRAIKADKPQKSEWITGFVIDNFAEFSFFIEGLETNIVQFLNDFLGRNHDEIRVFYNSTSKFEHRLYAEFLPIGGMYVITLHRPLRDILASQKFYLEGNVPILCWEALRKLDLLYRCNTSKDMLQFSLFPTPDELYSVDLEYGVPMHWKELVKQRARRETLVGFA